MISFFENTTFCNHEVGAFTLQSKQTTEQHQEQICDILGFTTIVKYIVVKTVLLYECISNFIIIIYMINLFS